MYHFDFTRLNHTVIFQRHVRDCHVDELQHTTRYTIPSPVKFRQRKYLKQTIIGRYKECRVIPTHMMKWN